MTINKKKYITFGLLSNINPGTGAIAGSVIGGIKGGLEQSPYEEISPTERLGKVATNAVLGAGVGASLGFLPKLATMDPNLSQVAATVERQTGVKILPNDPIVSKVNARTSTLENQANQLLEQQKILEQRQRNRELNRQLKRAQREQIRNTQAENFQEMIEPLVHVGDRIAPIVQAPIQAGRAARQAVERLKPVPNNLYSPNYVPYSKHIKVVTFSNVLPTKLYGVDRSTLATGLGLGAAVGTAVGGLKGATDSLTQAKINEQSKLDALNAIQDPYFRYRQEEIYNSGPAKVGRVIDTGVNTVGNTALTAGLGAGVGAGALGAALVGMKYLRGRK